MTDLFRTRPIIVGLALVLAIAAGRSAVAQSDAKSALGFESASDRVVLTYSGQPIAEFVFADPKIPRPHLANVRLKSQRQVTRHHPPVAGMDAVDHADMHPGVWLAFGDINGHDFWRNKARVEHVRFTHPPTTANGRLSFTTESRLLRNNGELIGRMDNLLTAEERPHGWRLTWEATLIAEGGALVLGDQEEMGFGARVATGITEKNGGVILNSDGLRSAKSTWGKPAAWCDYSGTLDGSPCGVTLMTAPSNFRGSWWHNRDYGLVVANGFGRAAMKQGEKSQVTIQQGDSLKLIYAATFHEGAEYDAGREYDSFVSSLKPRAAD